MPQFWNMLLIFKLQSSHSSGKVHLRQCISYSYLWGWGMREWSISNIFTADVLTNTWIGCHIQLRNSILCYKGISNCQDCDKMLTKSTVVIVALGLYCLQWKDQDLHWRWLDDWRFSNHLVIKIFEVQRKRLQAENSFFLCHPARRDDETLPQGRISCIEQLSIQFMQIVLYSMNTGYNE